MTIHSKSAITIHPTAGHSSSVAENKPPHRQVTWLPVDFHTQIGGKMVLLRAACLWQAKSQLNLNWKVTFSPRDVPASTENNIYQHFCQQTMLIYTLDICYPTFQGPAYIELLICWTCCGVKAKAKHVSWYRWLLSDAGGRNRPF